ncbi:conserved hypothetical protein [Bathymodiolus platifrons methanotrophic gill symbiont]|uniref:hypothetical protein n=1 Tax=unclassified Gammaproteobacteria TaxID=33811 RepID=UPI000B418101|nr:MULTISPECIES: hypothetical protein [unclassified Gammaproteobacteria]TXK95153.1 hypothetical protein BMR02_13125 [Methylococcaceae bacterium HT1]TXL13040.1 hypothetical protein BMR05_13315 [Methylococcaceae bacterium HT4]TXL17119.1 hypothetical protein BMR06_15175 [Methylococcaceae bacterium HT5]TXL21723.1 hypothetical protein BMR03_12460 [Methylococcaceae bacterium HT2]GAW87143.1 conserved hypothetical protein [Bathymodiolus platifrons methanotrophic gill symbiont]
MFSRASFLYWNNQVRLKVTIGLLIIGSCSSAVAGCLIRDVETLGSFKTYYFCKNSLARPSYQISSYLNDDQSFSLFNFDARGVSVVCHEYDIHDEMNVKCQSAFPNFRNLKKRYTNNNSTVILYDLKNDRDKEELLDKLGNRLDFRTGRNSDDVEAIGCFSGINLKKREVYLGFTKDGFNDLQMCLIQLEKYFAKNKKGMISLL